MPRTIRTPAERFVEKFEPDPETGCWPWTGATTVGGYPTFFDGERICLGHRWSYKKWIGPIPDELVLDHLCHDPETCKLGVLCPHRRCVGEMMALGAVMVGSFAKHKFVMIRSAVKH